MGYTEGTGAFWELCTALTDLLRIRGYSREKAGFSLPYKVYGAESAFLILISDLYDTVGPPLTMASLVPSLSCGETGNEATTMACKELNFALSRKFGGNRENNAPRALGGLCQDFVKLFSML